MTMFMFLREELQRWPRVLRVLASAVRVAKVVALGVSVAALVVACELAGRAIAVWLVDL